jgi:hypothetical protein
MGALLIILVYLALASKVEMTPYVGAQGTPTPTKPPTPGCVVAPGLKEGFESGTLGKFASTVATCAPGGCGWSAASDAVNTGSFSAFSPDLNNITDQRLTLITAIPIPPSGVSSAYLTFWHRFSFESAGGSNFDGGVLEYSTDGGGVWTDAGSLITTGGYNGTISSSYGSPLAGRFAWVQSSPLYPAFYQTTVNLISLVGNNLLIRFRQADDNSTAASGWWIDDVQISMNNCFRQRLPIVLRSSAAAQPAPGNSQNLLMQFWQSVGDSVAGLLQRPSSTEVTP